MQIHLLAYSWDKGGNQSTRMKPCAVRNQISTAVFLLIFSKPAEAAVLSCCSD